MNLRLFVSLKEHLSSPPDPSVCGCVLWLLTLSSRLEDAHQMLNKKELAAAAVITLLSCMHTHWAQIGRKFLV